MGITSFWFLWILAFILVSIVGLILQKRKQAFRHYGIASRLALLALLIWNLKMMVNSEEEYRLPLWVLVDTSESFRQLLQYSAEPIKNPALLIPVVIQEKIEAEFPKRELKYLNWFDPQNKDPSVIWSATSSLTDNLNLFLRQTNLPKGSDLILLTDGQENESDLSLRELGESLASYEIKLNTLVWQTPQPVDLELRTEANIQVAFVNESLDLPITIRASKSLQAGSSEVVLTDGKALLDKKTIKWDGTLQEIKLNLNWTPNKMGDQLLQLRLAPLDSETNLQNNLAYLSVPVRANRLKVLHIAGRTSWDVRYLRSLLEDSPEIDLISFFILRDPFEDANNIPENELALIQFPVEELFMVELFKFDVVVFHNFTIKKYLRNIGFQRSFQKFLSQGKRIIVVGGDQTEGEQGYAELFMNSRKALSWDWLLRHEQNWNYEEIDLLPPEHSQRQATFSWGGSRDSSGIRVLMRTSFGLGRIDWVADPHSWRWNLRVEKDQATRFQHLMFWQTLLYQPFFEQQRVFSDFRRTRPYHVSERIAGNLHLPTSSPNVVLRLVDLETGQAMEEQILRVHKELAALELITQLPGTYEMQISCRCDDMPDLKHPVVIVDEWLELHRTGWQMDWLAKVASSTGGKMIEVFQ